MAFIMGKTKDLIGQKYGRLTVVKRVGSDKNKNVLWQCVCDCGNVVIANSNRLNSGNTKSCGCIHTENLKKRSTTHGMSKSRLYKIWTAMKARCYDKNNISYKYYGELGIVVCEEWKHSFESFRDWSISHGYADNLTIDRIESDKYYCPENCRWITISEQQSNKKNNNLITYNGKTQILAKWAEELGIDRKILSHRISSYHWDVERAFTQKVRKSPKRKRRMGQHDHFRASRK